MEERLTADSVMTPDGEVVPLGPVDKDGRKVPLSTSTLYADSGMECTVRGYEYLLGAGVWRANCNEGTMRVDDMHLTRLDTFKDLRGDIFASLDIPLGGKGPSSSYNIITGLCKDCRRRCSVVRCQNVAFRDIFNRIGLLLAGEIDEASD